MTHDTGSTARSGSLSCRPRESDPRKGRARRAVCALVDVRFYSHERSLGAQRREPRVARSESGAARLRRAAAELRATAPRPSNGLLQQSGTPDCIRLVRGKPRTNRNLSRRLLSRALARPTCFRAILHDSWVSTRRASVRPASIGCVSALARSRLGLLRSLAR